MSVRSRFWGLLVAALIPLIATHSATNAQMVGRAAITAANANEIRQLARIGRGAINDLVWSPDRKTLVVFSPDNSLMVTSSDDGTIRLWGLPN